MKRTSKPTSASRKPSTRPRKRRAAPSLELALVAFAKFAHRIGIRWYVFGAQAVNLHGFPRMTADLDITVELGDRDPVAVVAQLAKAGFTARFPEPAFITATRVIPVVHSSTALPIDLVLAGPGLEEGFLDEVVVQELHGTAIPILSVENLIVTKLLAARPKDLEDIRELLAIREVDHEKIEQLLAVLEMALDQNDLRALYRRLRSR